MSYLLFSDARSGGELVHQQADDPRDPGTASAARRLVPALVALSLSVAGLLTEAEAETGGGQAQESDPTEQPLPSVEAPAEDALWLAASVGTRVDLKVMSGKKEMGEIVGSIVEQHEDLDPDAFQELFEPGTPPDYVEEVVELLVDGKLVDAVFEVPWGEESLQIVGEVVTPAGKKVPVDLELQVEIIWGAGIVIVPDGEVGLELKYFPACPWIYVRNQERWEPAVEILQNLRGIDRERAQRVSLGPVTPETDGEIVLQIREELPETTYLDHLELELPGHPGSILPAAASRGLGSLASTDRDYLVLSKGDVVEVVFRDQRLRRGRAIEPVIVATGYYEFLVPASLITNGG